ncbi:hypothetical protein BO94DRAFT_477640 [Aspergillus sclerotioniger CBS 115572]|uniref:Uncharacterized protein n=1 Tax=Aspergillus sclerotioniger CBS 115572 TaxID=1450535 RepID=A0A317V6A5_9EURO|nr:hypothetical protein BO94DRAFT_477640 [Aspergillus sclerotioniger CBS 115572]PWY69874.1 hypothetical protein BO94DRAFT_477640 [Aspergillus sclerotioniger CBS 115572]
MIPEIPDEPEPAPEPAPVDKVIEIEVHGIKAKFHLNRSDEELIPTRHLAKADHTRIVQRPVWAFRKEDDARLKNLKKWSKVDIAFRGVFQTLKKGPQFEKGLFEDENGSAAICPPRTNFKKVCKRQAQVIYALLDELMYKLAISRESEDDRKWFYLRPRFMDCRAEYWTGYRHKYKDGPFSASWITLDHFPDIGVARCVVPVSTTTEENQPLQAALAGKLQLIMGQLLINILRLHPPGDQIPDQEVFLIGLHGCKLYLLRAIFPGAKTSKLWCGRHNPTVFHEEQKRSIASTVSKRFYSRDNMARFMEQLNWLHLARSLSEEDPDPHVFQVLGSQEYDLWTKDGFRAARRLLAGLNMYLMSAQSKVGVLQEIFALFPYDESAEVEVDDGEAVVQSVQKEQNEVLEEEKRLEEEERAKKEEELRHVRTTEAIRSTDRDRIAGFRDIRRPWWDWVWEDKRDEGRSGRARG